MSEGEGNEFSYVHINYEYDIQVDKSCWLPKKWDIKVFGITVTLMVGSGWNDHGKVWREENGLLWKQFNI